MINLGSAFNPGNLVAFISAFLHARFLISPILDKLIPDSSDIHEIRTNIYRMEVKVNYVKCKKELIKINKSIKSKIDI